MPIYELKCKKCEEIFDFYQLKKESKAKCPKCNNDDENEFEKQTTIPAVHFRGIGWTKRNYVDSVDPTVVNGVKRIDREKVKEKDKELYKCKK